MIKLDRADTPAAPEHATIYLAFELSKAKWKLGVLLPGSQKLSRYTIGGGDLAALTARLADMRKKAAAAVACRPVRILSCYEAGLDGHWLHRWLTGRGIINHEIDPSSIEVNRRARRAKTDRIDLEKLMRAFLAHLRGEPRVCSIVHVPTVEEEDRKRRTRERDRLIKECTAHSNRIKGLLHGQGIRDVSPLDRSFVKSLAGLHTGDGHLLPERLKEEIVREHERLCVVTRQLKQLEAKSKAELRAARPGSPEARIMQLIDLKSIGPVGGQKLVNEVFYRDFDNRRQVGSYFGLTGTPITVATAAARRASAKPAIGAPVSSRSSWRGYGRFISPTAPSRRRRGHRVQPLLAERPPHDRIDIAGQHLCSVAQGFLPP